jgi:hypothetical protein
MLPYLIAGAIGFVVGKLLEEDEAPKYANGGLIAPNGKPSNLTPEQYKLVRTDAFKNWFGDWQNDPANASKVVDSNGEPLVVYHGTNKNFNIFQPTEYKRNFGTIKSNAFFFAKDRIVAEYIAELKSDEKSEQIILPVFLNIKNMLDFTDEDIVENVLPQVLGILPDDDFLGDTDLGSLFFVIENKEYAEEIKNMGYDGVQLIEGHLMEQIEDLEGEIIESYAVFQSNQIKLADGSNTTFDGNNPDISYAGGGKLADNIFDYLIKEKGFAPLGKGFWGKSNCTIKIDFSNVLYQQNGDNRVWFSPIEYSDYKKAFTILEFHCKDKNKGIGTALLKEIIQGADLFGYTIFIEPTSMKKYRVETDINTNDLKQWYSKYDFKPINDNYSDNVWLRNPNNPDIRFDEGGDIEDDDYYYDENDIYWTNNYLVHYLFSQMDNEFKHLEDKNLILSHDEKITFTEGNNQGRISMKPLGLWYAKGFEWVEWIQYQMPSWSSKYHYLHEIKTTDKVLKINNQEDAIKFAIEYGVYKKNSFDTTQYTDIEQIDWERVAKNWSGIEMVNPRANFDYLTERRLRWVGSWDIASGCVWKADGFSEINLLIDYKDYNNPDIRFDDGGRVSNYREFYDNLQIEDGSKYIGQKFADVFPYIGKRTSPSQFRISVKEYNNLLVRLENDNYTTKGIKTADLNRLEKRQKYIDKKKYLSRFYLDPSGTIIGFDNSDNADY